MADNKSQIMAEYSLGIRDYERYHCMLMKCDELALQIKPPYINPAAITPYNSILRQLYINLRPVIDEANRKKVEDFFKVIEEQLLKFSGEMAKQNQKVIKIDTKLLVDLERMHMLLLEIKQLVGLGINVTVKETLKKKLNRALLGF